MPDLYPIALTINLFLLFLTLVFFKLAIQPTLQHPSNNSKPAAESPLGQQSSSGQEESSQYCAVLGYLLSHYTFWGCCRKGVRGRMLVSMAVLAGVNFMLFFSDVWWTGAVIGPIVITGWLIGECLIEGRQGCQGGEQKVKKGCLIGVGVIGVSLQLALCGLVYRNYINSHLQSYMLNLLIATAIDHLAARPTFMVVTAMVALYSQTVRMMSSRYQKQLLKNSIEAKDVMRVEMLSRNNLIKHLDQQPQPISMKKSEQPSSMLKINKEKPAIPSQSEVLSRNSSNRSTNRRRIRPHQLHQLTRHNELRPINEIDPEARLRQYHCMNLRKKKKEAQINNLALQEKNCNVISKKVEEEFVLEDFLCKESLQAFYNPDDIENAGSKPASNEKKPHFYRIFPLLEKDGIEEEQGGGAYCNQPKSQTDSINMHKDSSIGTRTRRTDNTRASILKVRHQGRESGELEQIKVNTPDRRKRHSYNRSFAENNPITEEEVTRRRRHRRRGTRCQQSQPYFADRNERLIDLYLPGKRSELDTVIKKSQKMNKSIGRSNGKGLDQPVLHDGEENTTEFFVPSF